MHCAWWHSGLVGLLFRLAEFWWLILPLGGVVIAGLKALYASQRRTERGSEGDRLTQRRVIAQYVAAHSRTDARWLDYEMDVAKLLDFPLMTDMKDPLTMRFHKAKLRADMLRPVKADDLLDDRDARLEYREAVHDYVTAFQAAEAEAIRRRRSDFSPEGQQRLARAQSLFRLAADSAATTQERRQAYERGRKELDGLIVLPATTRASLERRIAGEIEA